MGWLDDQVVLVTGGGSGLGRAVCDRFIKEGARLGVLDRSAAKVAALKEEFGSDIVVVEGDVRLPVDHAEVVESTVAAFGRLDVLITNAGLWDYGQTIEQLEPTVLAEAFDELFGVNVKGYLLAIQAALPHLRATNGTIILTLSNASVYPGGGGVLYTAAKHADLGILRQLAYELAPAVRVHGVAPALLSSDLRGPRALGQDGMAFGEVLPLARMAKMSPLEVESTAGDSAGAYVLLASRANSRAATGAVIDFSAMGVAGKKLADLAAERL